MKHYDLFNGDADGICALQQLRLIEPRPDATPITGVKRDIKLLSKLKNISNGSITVLDISLDRNRDDLSHLLNRNNRITYIDHHYAGDIPSSPLLTTHINPAPDVCTSLIVDSLIDGKHRKWAVCGAFGDNLHKPALEAARSLSLDEKKIIQLRELGELLNYNGYGETIEDLHFAPDELYLSLQSYEDPIDFCSSPTLIKLRDGFKNDLALANEQQVIDPGQHNRLYHFPGKAWAKRIVGIFSNLKARKNPDRAHAILIDNADGTLRISVRAPLNNPKDADTLCRKFPTGGGRAAAAGINNLPPEMKEDFANNFYQIFS